MSKNKRLYRSTDTKLVAGVLAGLAEYFNQDPTIWRLGFVVLLIVTGLFPGVLAYLLFWIIVPERPTIEPVDQQDYQFFS